MIGTLLIATALGATVPQAAKRTIADANSAWLEAMKRQDAIGVAAPYADDAVFVTPTGETLHGRAAIETFHRERFQKSGRVVDGRDRPYPHGVGGRCSGAVADHPQSFAAVACARPDPGTKPADHRSRQADLRR